MISLLWIVVYILVAALVGYLIYWALGLIPGLPKEVRTIVIAILGVVFAIWLITAIIGAAPPGPLLRQ